MGARQRVLNPVEQKVFFDLRHQGESLLVISEVLSVSRDVIRRFAKRQGLNGYMSRGSLSGVESEARRLKINNINSITDSGNINSITDNMERAEGTADRYQHPEHTTYHWTPDRVKQLSHTEGPLRSKGLKA